MELLGYGFYEVRIECCLDIRQSFDAGIVQFNLKLLPLLAPSTCKLVRELAARGKCATCRFYRHEPVPVVRQRTLFERTKPASISHFIINFLILHNLVGSSKTRYQSVCCVVLQIIIGLCDWCLAKTVFVYDVWLVKLMIE